MHLDSAGGVVIRERYPTDVTVEEWAFVAPYLTLLDPLAPRRRRGLRWPFELLQLFRVVES